MNQSPDDRLRVEAMEPVDQAAVLLLRGDLDLETVGILGRHTARLGGDGVRTLVIDMEQVGFVDSTGLSELIKAFRRQRDAGGELVLRSPRPSVVKVLSLAGLDRVFTIDGSAAGAGRSRSG